MYLDLRSYSKCHQANFTSYCIIIFRAYILCKAYDIQSPWKYFPNTYTISSQDGTVFLFFYFFIFFL